MKHGLQLTIPKHLAEKNSICNTYGRSKTMIEQRCKKIQQQLQQATNAVQLFEEHSAEMNVLSSIINIFIREHQQKLQHEFEYRRQKTNTDLGCN